MANRQQQILAAFGHRPGTGRVQEFTGNRLTQDRVFEGIGGQPPITPPQQNRPSTVVRQGEFNRANETEDIDIFPHFLPGQISKIFGEDAVASQGRLIAKRDGVSEDQVNEFFDTMLERFDTSPEKLVDQLFRGDIRVPLLPQGASFNDRFDAVQKIANKFGLSPFEVDQFIRQNETKDATDFDIINKLLEQRQ